MGKFPEGSVEAIYFDLKKNWKQTVLNIFKEGGDPISAHLAIGVTASEHKKLMALGDYFEVFENGIAMSESYWLKWAKENLEPTIEETEEDGIITKTFTYGKPDVRLFKEVMDRLFNWSKKIEKIDKPKDKDDPKDEAKKMVGKYLRSVK